jgi:hypothetical protein
MMHGALLWRSTMNAAFGLMAASLPLLAEPARAVGDFGVTLGYGDVSNIRDGSAAEAGFVVIDGSYSFPVGERMLFGFDANLRSDSFAGTSLQEDENPQSQYRIGAHALWSLGPDTRLGGFVAYGDTRSQGEARDNDYDYFLVGVEARQFLGDDVMAYGQLALGDKGRSGEDEEEGFNSGKSLRLGATWFATDRSAYTFDVEFASASPYIDGRDDGEFFRASLSGETRLSRTAPLMATYSVSYDLYDATTENDSVEEVQIAIGVRYVFGGQTQREAARAGRSIGTPHLPGRASAWTEFLD